MFFKKSQKSETETEDLEKRNQLKTHSGVSRPRISTHTRPRRWFTEGSSRRIGKGGDSPEIQVRFGVRSIKNLQYSKEVTLFRFVSFGGSRYLETGGFFAEVSKYEGPTCT